MTRFRSRVILTQMKLTIYANGESHSIDKALKMLTDEWIDDGNYCAQTVIDLRDALKFYIKKCKILELEKMNSRTFS